MFGRGVSWIAMLPPPLSPDAFVACGDTSSVGSSMIRVTARVKGTSGKHADELGVSSLFLLAAALVVWVVSTSWSVFVPHPADASAVNVSRARWRSHHVHGSVESP